MGVCEAGVPGRANVDVRADTVTRIATGRVVATVPTPVPSTTPHESSKVASRTDPDTESAFGGTTTRQEPLLLETFR